MMDAGEALRKSTLGPPRALSGYTLALNYLPLAYVLAGLCTALTFAHSAAARAGVAALWIYLVPPLVSRLASLIAGPPHGRGLGQHDAAYKVWWLQFQMQVVLNRLPWLDELLRLVPGLYALWLGLWGSKVSPFAYWGPGARVLDRGLIEVGPGAVLGAESALAGHAGTLTADGHYVLDIAPAVVEAGAILGARSGVGPGGRVTAGTMLPAGRGVKPFAVWPRTGTLSEAEAG